MQSSIEIIGVPYKALISLAMVSLPAPEASGKTLTYQVGQGE